MNWIQLSLTISAEQAEGFEDILLSLGAQALTLQDNADQPLYEPGLGETPLWQQTRLTALFTADTNTQQLLESLAAQYYKALPPHRIELVEDKDWVREWMDNYHPIHVHQNLWICPSWQTPPEKQAINLMLDPGLAFGTGTHPTTLLCLQWLAEYPPADLTLIDYGCGSGILAIAGLLLGAHKAIGVDIDPQALTATAQNAERNNIEKTQLDYFLANDFKATQPVDLLMANILAEPLYQLADDLATLVKAHGKLVLSGILLHQADTLIERYQPWFDFEPIAHEQDWVRLVATRKAH